MAACAEIVAVMHGRRSSFIAPHQGGGDTAPAEKTEHVAAPQRCQRAVVRSGGCRKRVVQAASRRSVSGATTVQQTGVEAWEAGAHTKRMRSRRTVRAHLNKRHAGAMQRCCGGTARKMRNETNEKVAVVACFPAFITPKICVGGCPDVVQVRLPNRQPHVRPAGW